MSHLLKSAAVLALLLLAPAASAQDGAGDVFVSVAAGGGLIYLDGATTGIIAPGVVRAVTPGPHVIRVDDGCKSASADVIVRANAVERVALELALGSGTIRVEATPPETRVTEGGTELGVGSFGPVSLDCGPHVIVGTAPGRQTLTYTVDVPLRGHMDVRLDLPQASLGSIAITPTPMEAEVLVDGLPRGFGPMTVDALPAGLHKVSARMEGYLTSEQDITVVAYQIVRSTIELTQKPPPVPVSKRLGLDRADWPRIGLDAGVSAASIGVGVVAWLQYSRAVENYDSYAALTYADDPQGFYASEVAAPRTLSFVLAGTSGALAVTSGVLWATTHARPGAPARVKPAKAVVPSPPAPAGSTPPASTPPASTPPASTPPVAPTFYVAPGPLGVTIGGQF